MEFLWSRDTTVADKRRGCCFNTNTIIIDNSKTFPAMQSRWKKNAAAVLCHGQELSAGHKAVKLGSENTTFFKV